MAEQHHLITVDDRSDEWALLFEIARLLAPKDWTLVGGLMVQVHAVRAEVDPTRYTADVDVLISVDARMSDVAGPLLSAGFTAQTPHGAGPFHRFRRDQDEVDVMVPMAAGRARWAGRGVLRAPGGGQAESRRDVYTVQARHARTSVTIHVPDSLGAIVAKAAAFRVDSRDPMRHLEDLVVLLAAAERTAFDQASLSRRDRHHLGGAMARLQDEQAAPWSQLSDRDRAFARAAFLRLAEAASAP